MSFSSSESPALQLVPPATEGQRDKRDRIIERAIIMFNQLGYEGVRVSDLTDSLSMGKGTFYLYFHNKKELLLSCFDHVGELIEELESLPGIRDGDFFSKVGPRVESIGHRAWFPGLVNLLRAAELSPDEEIKVKAREAYDTIARYLRLDLQEAIDAGTAREVDVDLAAYGFIGLAENLWFRSRLDEAYSPEQVVRFAVEATRRLLSSGSPEERAPVQALDGAVCLVSRDGMSFDLDSIRYGGESLLAVGMGQARVDLEPSQVSSLTLEPGGDECVATVTALDGTSALVHVDGSIEIAGASALGIVRIALRDVCSITPR
jgi:AcrR family transcriptional regulator